MRMRNLKNEEMQATRAPDGDSRWSPAGLANAVDVGEDFGAGDLVGRLADAAEEVL
jgi:hypothetical protein